GQCRAAISKRAQRTNSASAGCRSIAACEDAGASPRDGSRLVRRGGEVGYCFALFAGRVYGRGITFWLFQLPHSATTGRCFIAPGDGALAAGVRVAWGGVALALLARLLRRPH